MFRVVCQGAFFECVPEILHSLCENTTACDFALNRVRRMNSGVSEGWETPGQNSNPTVPVVKHCLSQVYLLIKNIGHTFPSASEDLPVVAIGNEVP